MFAKWIKRYEQKVIERFLAGGIVICPRSEDTELRKAISRSMSKRITINDFVLEFKEIIDKEIDKTALQQEIKEIARIAEESERRFKEAIANMNNWVQGSINPDLDSNKLIPVLGRDGRLEAIMSNLPSILEEVKKQCPVGYVTKAKFSAIALKCAIDNKWWGESIALATLGQDIVPIWQEISQLLEKRTETGKIGIWT